MSKNDITLSEDTVIVRGSIPINEYRKYFRQALGAEVLGNAASMDFTHWLECQAGKTVKEAKEEYSNPLKHENIKDFLTERRFNIISESDKDFIIAFDEAMCNFGYDFGGEIQNFTIIYGKTGTKSRSVAARIFIRDDQLKMRLYLKDIEKRRTYVENAPPYIKDVFTGSHGDCKHCEDRGHRKSGFCMFKKTYMIDGRVYEKCNGAVFMFRQLDLEKLPDYIGLMSEFYPMKNRKIID